MTPASGGGFPALLSSAADTGGPGRPDARPLSRATSVGVMLGVAAWVAAVSVIAWPYFMDDAFTGFTYARNLATGAGLTFHQHWPAVEGVTNLGWTLLLAGVGTFAPIPIAAKVLGAAFVVASAGLLWSVGRSVLGGHRLLPLAPILLLLTSAEFMYFSLAGMETSLLAAVLLLLALVSHARPRSMGLAALGALAFVIRPEAALVLPAYLFILALREPASRARAARIGAVYVGLIGIVTAGRFLVFGALVPNTLAAKPSSAGSVLGNIVGSLLVDNWVLPHPMTLSALALVAVGAWALLRRSGPLGIMLVTIATVGLGFSFYALRDWTGLSRYLAPYLPAVYLLACSGLATLLQALWNWRRWSTSIVLPYMVLTMALALTQLTFFAGLLSPERVNAYPGYVLMSERLERPSTWIKEHLPAGTVIATRRIGAVSYYSQLPIFDYAFGLTDAEVAQEVRTNGGAFALASAPALERAWRAADPRCILEDEAVMSSLADQSGGSLASFTVHGARYGEFARFPIGTGVDWILACRIGDPAPRV